MGVARMRGGLGDVFEGGQGWKGRGFDGYEILVV